MLSKTARLFAVLTLGTSASLAQAQQIEPAQLQALVQLSGQMHALAAVCKTYPAEELAGLKAEQRQMTTGLGMTGADFDSIFQSAFNEGKSQLEAASATQRQQACDQAEAMRQAQVPAPPNR